MFILQRSEHRYQAARVPGRRENIAQNAARFCLPERQSAISANVYGVGNVLKKSIEGRP